MPSNLNDFDFTGAMDYVFGRINRDSDVTAGEITPSAVRWRCFVCGQSDLSADNADGMPTGWVASHPEDNRDRATFRSAICNEQRCRQPLSTCRRCNYGVGMYQTQRLDFSDGLGVVDTCRYCSEAHAIANGAVRCEGCHSYVGTNETVYEMPTAEGLMSEFCQECANQRVVMNYTTNPLDYLGFIGEPNDGIFYGVELEVEVSTKRDFFEVATNTNKSVNEFAIMKHDGSLNNGFEIVSAPMSMDAHKGDAWDKFFIGGGNDGLRAAKTRTCGMHVHISREPLSTMTVGKIIEFIHARDNSEFIRVIAGRTSNHYCEFGNDHKATQVLRHNSCHRERYNAVNLQREATVEIRIFKGTISRPTFLKNLEFCQALVKYASLHSISEHKSHQLFALWVANNKKDYPTLFQFLNDKWFVKKRWVANTANAYVVERHKIDGAAKAEQKLTAERKTAIMESQRLRREAMDRLEQERVDRAARMSVLNSELASSSRYTSRVLRTFAHAAQEPLNIQPEIRHLRDSTYDDELVRYTYATIRQATDDSDLPF